jgi:SAM-dependent methyltransferase
MPQNLRTIPTRFETLLSSDVEFDRIYDLRIRVLSAMYWTPIRVAARAARLLSLGGATRVLDIGSGVGKFCLVGALTADAHFVGIERRKDLVDIARGAASALQAERASFVHADMDGFAFDGFDGFYLYNPFFEQISRYLTPIDDTLERTDAAYRYFIRLTVEKLAALRPPVAVVTFNGFGGAMPRDFAFRGDEPAGTDRLELWVKD